MVDFVLADRAADTVASATSSSFTTGGNPGASQVTSALGTSINFALAVSINNAADNYTVYTVQDQSGNVEVSYGALSSISGSGSSMTATIGRLSTPLWSTNVGTGTSGQLTYSQVSSWGTNPIIFQGCDIGLIGSLSRSALAGLANIGGSAQRYFGPAVTGYAASVGTTALGSGYTYFTPIKIGKFFSSLSILGYISALAGSSATGQIGVYTDDQGAPAVNIGNSSAFVTGNQGGGATGWNSIPITLSAPQRPGTYWAGLAVITAAATWYTFSAGQAQIDPEITGLNSTATPVGYYGELQTYLSNTSLPATISQSSLGRQSGAIPIFEPNAGF
jgi:hypothetical protein